MSEYLVDAYFLEESELKAAIGSKDKTLLAQVLADDSEIIKQHDSRLTGKTLETAITEIIMGQPTDKRFSFSYGFALWAIIHVIAKQRPKDHYIPYPFVPMYDVVEVVENTGRYPELTKVFQSLDNGSDYALPAPSEWQAEIPNFSFMTASQAGALQPEVTRMAKDIKQDLMWTYDLENEYDIERMLAWITEAHTKKRSLCMVLEGNL